MRFGLYAPSRFAIPTASSQWLQAGRSNPGGGTIIFGGPDGTLRGLGYLGSAPDPTTLAELEAFGYDPGMLSTLEAMGVSDEQLLALPYPADSAEMAAALSALMNQLSGATPAPGQPATSASSYQQIMPAVLTSNLGTFDLAKQSAWNDVANVLRSVYQGLQQLAAKFPNDPDVASSLDQYRSAAAQFVNAWTQVFHSSPPTGLSGLGDAWGVVEGAGIILGGVVMSATVGVPITLAVGAVLATMWAIKQFTASKNASTAVAATQAQTQQTQAVTMQTTCAALQVALARAQSSGDTITAQTLIAQLKGCGAAPVASAPMTALEAWLTSHALYIGLSFGALLILPKLFERHDG